MKLSELHVLIQGDTKGLDKALDHAEKHTKDTAFVMSDEMMKVTSKMAMVGAGLTAAITVPFLAAANQAAKMASDMAESASKTNQVFGASAKVIQDFAKTSADSLGVTKKAAMDAASSYGLILQASGLVEKQSAVMSLSLTKLSADLASFFNVGIQEAMTSLKAGLVGESEPLRRFGVLLSEAAVEAKAVAMGLAEVGAKLTEGQKVQARYALILEQTAKAQGDFTRTSQGLANQERITQAQFEEASTSLGEKVLPIKLQLVKAVSSMVKTFTELPEPVRNGMLGVAAIAAAAGPAALGLSAVARAGMTVVTMSKALGPALLTMAGNSGAMIGMSNSATLAAGALGYVKVALTALTGPVGVAIAVVAGMAVAWSNNFLGIQEIVKISFKGIDSRLEQSKNNLQEVLAEMNKEWLKYYSKTGEMHNSFGGKLIEIWKTEWKIKVGIVSHALSAVLDIFNAAMGGILMLNNRSFDSLNASTKASLLRLVSLAQKWSADIIQASLKVLKFFTGPMSFMPGIIGDQYRAMVEQAEAYAAGLKFSSKLAGDQAKSFQAMADSQRSVTKTTEDMTEAQKVAFFEEQKRRMELALLNAQLKALMKGQIGGGATAGNGEKQPKKSLRPMNPFGGGDIEVKLSKELGEAMGRAMMMGLSAASVEGAIAARGIIGSVLIPLTKAQEQAQEAIRKAAEAPLEAFRKQREEIYAQMRMLKTLREKYGKDAVGRMQVDFPTVPVEEIERHIADTKRVTEETKLLTKAAEQGTVALVKMFNPMLNFAGVIEDMGLTSQQMRSIAIMANPVLAMVPKIKEMATAFNDERNKRFRDTMRDIALQVQILGTNSQDAKLKIKLLSEGMSEAQAMAVVHAERQRTEMERYQEMLKGIVNTATSGIQESLDQLLRGRLPSALKAIRNMFSQVFAQIYQDYIQSQLSKLILNALGGVGSGGRSGGGFLGGFGGVSGALSSLAGMAAIAGSAASGAWSGSASLAAFADGGYMRPGQLSIVGERGPEIMVSGRGGTVIPNEALGSQTINVHITVYANDAASFAKTKEQIASEVGAAISKAAARGS